MRRMRLGVAPVGGSLLRGHGCPKCAGTMRKSHAEFVEELKSRRDDVIIVGPYVKALEKTRFRFLKCGHEWDVTPAHILNGRGCPLCAHSRRGASQRLTMERFLKRLHKIDRNLVVREGGKYVNYTTPIPLRCNACKYEYEVKPSDVLHGGGCPNCHRACTSFPEQFIRHAFVRMLGESEVLSRDKTAAGVELDVCIPALRAAVEPGSWYWHRNLVERDREKRLLCERKGIRLITVYDHYDETAVPFDDCLVTPCDLCLPPEYGQAGCGDENPFRGVRAGFEPRRGRMGDDPEEGRTGFAADDHRRIPGGAGRDQ